MPPPPFEGVDRRIRIHSTLQSMSFIFQPFQGKDETVAEKVAAVLVYEDHVFTPPESIRRSRLEIVTFERRLIQLAPGFSDISGGNTELSSMWEWYTAPHATNTVVSPIGTTIQTLQPLHAIPPYSLALAIISDGRTRSRVHLDLCAKQWNPKGHYPVKGIRGDFTTLVVSQGAERGQLGLCAVVDQYRSQHLGVVNKLDEQPILGELAESASDTEKYAAWAATSIILAERQETNWSDVIHALQAILPPSPRHRQTLELTRSIIQRIYNLAANEIGMDQLFLVSRVQIALFSVFKNHDDDDNDARLALATDILRLNEASELVDRCATFDDDGSIMFDLDSIWPLLAVFDWAISVIARAMRQAILVDASAEWQGSNDSLIIDPHSPLLILLHPTLRSLCIRILSQLHQLSTFLSTLDRPISQPENKVLPASSSSSSSSSSNTRDPMATVVAREQIRDIPQRQGVDVEQWGRALESVTMSPEPDQTDIDQSLIQLSITPLRPHLPALFKILHTSSALFTSEYFQNLNQNQRVMYDAIDWRILHDRGGGGTWGGSGDETKEVVVCDRCGWQTEALTKSAPVSGTNTISPWAEWKSQAEENCICGGTWVRKQVEMED
ncbi:hypothetical protein CNF02060 [Cryptococcus gattii WM276]|uniref:Mediator of RNA polymerase II transcription subunit 16 n=1 Tax=Cryptococcus gattii serotype B (strain WM276 / ATCC MYA-4071) TaxID=367775 RepID=E6R892_CRYGW|nr:uncharacterized protein CGB_F4010W [Cryptococcus gattii WM276]ADV23015.1 hypothetical protein CNF02060 [Cryptococcus gattii WM276]